MMYFCLYNFAPEMKKLAIKSILPIFLFAGMVACNSSDASEKQVEKKENKEEVAGNGEQLPKVKADRMLVIELEGMVCKMGCGGSIRADLYASNAVELVEFDYSDENPIDVARVAYDRDKITADEIVKIISETNDGQFVVKSTKSEPFVSEQVGVNESSSEKRIKSTKVSVKASSSSFDIPDLFDLFSFVI